MYTDELDCSFNCLKVRGPQILRSQQAKERLRDSIQAGVERIRQRGAEREVIRDLQVIDELTRGTDRSRAVGWGQVRQGQLARLGKRHSLAPVELLDPELFQPDACVAQRQRRLVVASAYDFAHERDRQDLPCVVRLNQLKRDSSPGSQARRQTLVLCAPPYVPMGLPTGSDGLRFANEPRKR